MAEDVIKILLGSGIVAASVTFIYHQLSLRRQYRQTLEQKMIERISYLVEHYYGQISSCSENLRNDLNLTLHVISQGGNVGLAIQISFYHLISYLHHIDRLTQERPVPLFPEIKEEINYKDSISDIYDNLPFNYYDISHLLNLCRREERLLPACEVVVLIGQNPHLRNYYNIFSQWLSQCQCRTGDNQSCSVHKVISACLDICLILNDQMLKMYRLWYNRRKKLPKKKD